MSTNVMTRTNDDRGTRTPKPPKRTRGVALVLALLLAVAATAAVFLYLSSVKKERRAPVADSVQVIVSKQDIPTGTKLDSLISAGAFTTLEIPKEAIVAGAVTDLAQLRGRTTKTFLLQGEQITTARLEGSTQATGGVLGIPEGNQAVTIRLDPERVPGEVLQPGDHVSVYATYSGVQIIAGTKLGGLLAGKASAADAATTTEAGDFTVDLVPDVLVLRVSNQDQTGASTQPNDSVLVTLALLPADAQNVVFSQEKGAIWLALLPPGQKGLPQGLVWGTPILQQALHGVQR
jgi:pilus assembly protein CpaB